jgi:hypothetical protein
VLKGRMGTQMSTEVAPLLRGSRGTKAAPQTYASGSDSCAANGDPLPCQGKVLEFISWAQLRVSWT